MEPCANWEGDTLLECFLRNSIADHKPRATTGTVQCTKMGSVMTIQSTEYLDSIFKKLAKEGFSSAPVCRGKELVGHLTLLDLVRHVNGLFFGVSEKDWVDWWEKQISFQLTPASHIVPIGDEVQSPFPCMNKNFTSFSGLEMMARNRNHQILQLDDDKQLCGILTQSMLISFLRQSKVKWPEALTNLRVGDFAGMTRRRELITVSEKDLAINAFLKMDESDIHGLPIVNHRGVLTGCISVRDLKGCGTDGSKFARLYQNVKTFKAMVLQENDKLAPTTHYSRKNIPGDAVFVTPENTMADVIHKMDDGNLHRIFICSQESADDGEPIPHGVISQSDVLRQALDAMIDSAGELRPMVGERTAAARQTTRKVSPGKARSPEGRREGQDTVMRKGPSPIKRSIPIS